MADLEKQLNELREKMGSFKIEGTGPIRDEVRALNEHVSTLAVTVNTIQRDIENDHAARVALEDRQKRVEQTLGGLLDIFGTMQNKLASVGSLPEQTLTNEQRSNLADANDEFNVV